MMIIIIIMMIIIIIMMMIIIIIIMIIIIMIIIIMMIIIIIMIMSSPNQTSQLVPQTSPGRPVLATRLSLDLSSNDLRVAGAKALASLLEMDAVRCTRRGSG